MRKKYRDFSLCGLFTALIICGAYIRISISVIPITLQTTFVCLSGLIIGGKKAVMSTTIYMIMGLIGLPVFAGGGGVSYILRPTFGYIIGFIAGAGLTGYISHYRSKYNFIRYFAGSVIGLITIYFFGIIYNYILSNFYLHSNITLRYLVIYSIIPNFPTDFIFLFIVIYIAKRMNKIFYSKQ